MAMCEVCGNNYDKAFTVTMAGSKHTFDSFECAIHALAPECAACHRNDKGANMSACHGIPPGMSTRGKARHDSERSEARLALGKEAAHQ